MKKEFASKIRKHAARKRRIKAQVAHHPERKRFVVYRSLNQNYAQIIDDASGKVLASASDLKMKKGTKTERAAKVGEEIAKKAAEQKITNVVFDRNGYKYHGRIKAIADSARENGLTF